MKKQNKTLLFALRELFHRTQQIHTQFIIIPIAKQITNIHRQFTEETPLFYSQILTIEPLNAVNRILIIKKSFVIKDLYTLIDNALLHSWMSFEDRQLSNIDFDYAFNEFKLINVKLLDDDTKKSNRPTLHWSDIGGMDDLKQELIQTVQWRFQIYEPTFSSIQIIFSNVPIRLISGILLYGPSGCGKTKHLYIGFPTKSDIISILKIWTKKIHLSDDIKFDDETIISHCEMYTGADIKALIYNAQLAAFDEYQSKQSIIIHKHHFISAIKQTPYSIPVHMRNANEHLYV
ncbi:unnamed protein product [Rotaria sp. Silwood2]|nr:unnamed protein product [Rotaria sp. Silwood2]